MLDTDWLNSQDGHCGQASRSSDHRGQMSRTYISSVQIFSALR